MATVVMRDALLECLQAVDRGQLEFGVIRGVRRDLAPPTKQALVFLKPEMLSGGPDPLAAIDLVWGGLEQADLTIHGIVVLGSRRLETVIAKHYGVINYVSRLGSSALSEPTMELLRTAFRTELMSDAAILGAHQTIEKLGLTVDEVTSLWEAATSTKLAPGTYAAPINVDGSQCIILNGFHPGQLRQYTAEDARVVGLEVHWEKASWSEFRSQIVGATNPQQASHGSIRSTILERRTELQLREVSTARNGIHGSAGPLEAMVELSHFFAIDHEQTCFGRLLSDALMVSLAKDVTCGGANTELVQRLFDATEDADPYEAVERIRRESALP